MEERARTFDRIGIAVVLLLIAAFTLGAMYALSGSDNAFAGSRDDGPDGVVAEEDEGDGDGDGGDGDDSTATGTTPNTGPSNSATNDTATGTVTDPTGTTRGTGPSNTATNDTATGTRTRGR